MESWVFVCGEKITIDESLAEMGFHSNKKVTFTKYSQSSRPKPFQIPNKRGFFAYLYLLNNRSKETRLSSCWFLIGFRLSDISLDP